MEAPEPLILDLLKANASAASVKDKNGLLPIHLAFCGGYWDEKNCSIVGLGEVIHLFDDDSFPHFSAELEDKLVSVVAAKENKHLLSTKNRSGSLLLHIVISCGYSLVLIRAVVSGYNNALIEANSKELLPFALCFEF